jgi:glycosyltransferase involved in cell wall biosynthesis
VVDFTVAIPVYNGDRFLTEALLSIEMQNLAGVEVLVSDNASTDGTANILAEWKDRLPLRVIRRPQILSMRDHFNALLDDVNCEAYVLLCHDDYFVDPDALDLARAALRDNPDVAAVYCDLIYVDEKRRTLAQRNFSRSGRFNPDATGRKCLATGRNLFGIPLAVRRSALGDTRYGEDFLYAMDIDLSWSLARKGGAYHIGRPLIANRYSDSNMTWRLLGRTLDEYLLLARKHANAPGPLTRARMAAICQFVTVQKFAFRYYAIAKAWLA